MHRWSRFVAAALAALSAVAAFAGPPPADAAARLGGEQIVVSGPGARAVIDRSPFRIRFQTAAGRTVLAESSSSGGSLAVPPVPQVQFGAPTAPGPALYSPLAFLVGQFGVTQQPSGQWEGNLRSVTRGGTEYAARDVTGAQRAGAGVRLRVSTSDPSGRYEEVTIEPGPPGMVSVFARVLPSDGVAGLADSFVAGRDEAFHGFGGRHNSLDQGGNQFFNWLQQENLSSGSPSALTAPSPSHDYLFPNGQDAAYYAQSSFISSDDFGFLLERNAISEWRMASDRAGAWRVGDAVPSIAYVVAPGGARQAIDDLTRVGGRQRPPPRWAVGPAFDRQVGFPAESPADYLAEVRDDLRQIARHHVPVDAYRIEAWHFIHRDVLRRLMERMRRRGIHPMLYFRAFVGTDEIGTDSPRAYGTALARGYVATHADGSPYVFTSNFFRPGAQIDFTNPAARRWYQRRITAALRLGADGFMADFGEQVQSDMRFADGETGATMHNRLPVLFQRTVRKAVERFERRHPRRRIFFFSRAGYSGTPGSARYEGANFPGDETTDFSRSAGLASLAPDMLNRAVGGAYGYTTDIGGYFDVGPYQATTRELFLRWAEWAALSPLFRLHGSVLNGVHAPWTYGPTTVRAYNRLSRLHLHARPLILRLWRRAERTGIPITRPLWLADPRDRRAALQEQEWLLGPNVLVAPVVWQGATSRRVYFPRGCWRSAASGERVRGPRSALVDAPLLRLPYFLRCGTHPFGADG